MAKDKIISHSHRKAFITFWVIFGCIVLVGAIVAIVYFATSSKEEETKETIYLDDNAFYIGTYSRTKALDNDQYFLNRLYIDVYEDHVLLDSFSFRGDEFLTAEELGLDGDYKFTQIEGRYTYGDIGFVNLSDFVNELTGGLGLSYWSLLSDGNYFEIWTEWTAGPIMSEPVIVNEAGIYLINIPTEDGAVVDLQHANVYIREVVE